MTTAPDGADDDVADDTGDASESADHQRDAGAAANEFEKPILLFDGVCNLCNGFVRFVVRFDAEGRFEFAPLQSDVGEALLDRHGLETEQFDSVVLVEDGEVYERSTAVLRVARHLDGPWPLSYPLIFLPERVRDGAYDLVAEHRYQIFGKKDECPMPDPELRERFANRTLE